MVKITGAERGQSPWQFVVGVLAADLGVALLGLGAWDALNSDMRILVYLAGTVCLLSGLSLIWPDTINLSVVSKESPLTANGVYLGRFKLNNYSFEAYERAANDGRTEFRLVACPLIDSAKEAAVVRYMVNEGLIESLWPQMSKQIEKDANWAFTD
ncbi:MAG TPA: hypothetical protein VJX28_06790 [Chthoniobacterales bacterium]|nr:hypothetical protein [Chthoniobacterales bacterium]